MAKERQRVFPSTGGSFEIRGGKAVRVAGGTDDHPEGNRPRDNEGRPLGVAAPADPAPETPAKPAEPDSGKA